MKFEDYKNNTQKEIERELFNLLDKWLDEVEENNLSLKRYLEIFILACHGGKRLRGILMRLGFEMAGGQYNPEIIKVASAYEIFQTAILIHDDLIDKSAIRRGKPSVYKALGGDHHAISQAVCLGDLGNFLSIKLLSETGFSQDLKVKAISLMSQIMHDTTLGQMLDIDGAKNRNKLTEKDILDIYYQKTAKYSFLGPLQIGGILGALEDKYIDKLAIIGKYLGVAFQLQDDNWVVDGNEGIIGKTVTSDIIEGKASLIYQYAYNRADREQKRYLEKYYGQEIISKKQVGEIRKIFITTGGFAYAKKKVVDYLNKARKEITALKVKDEAKDLLSQLVDYLFIRTK